MNYLKIYNDLMLDAENKPKDEKYKELHHIIPKCMGGSNDKSNLIKLTARQHFIAHWLLYKIYKTSALVHAWNNMSIIGNGQSDRNVNSKNFNRVKIERSKILSESSKGVNNNFYGKTHTDATKKHIGKLASEREKTQDVIDNWVIKVAKKPKTSEHKVKIGRKGMIMLINIQTNDVIRIYKSDKHLYDESIWKNNRTQASLINWTCIHCNKSGVGASNYKRWHNDNCKYRKIDENC